MAVFERGDLRKAAARIGKPGDSTFALAHSDHVFVGERLKYSE